MLLGLIVILRFIAKYPKIYTSAVLSAASASVLYTKHSRIGAITDSFFTDKVIKDLGRKP